MRVVCSACSKTFHNKYSLIRHIARIHSSGCPQPQSRRLVYCDLCNASFSYKSNLKRHISKVHLSSRIERHKIVCLYCNSTGTKKKFTTRKLLREHCVKEHNVEFKEEILQFSSMSEFKNWQVNVQNSTLCRFISTRGVRKMANGVKKYYLNCHRDGYFTSTSKSAKKIKTRGSNKINATCTAQMLVSENTNGSVTVHYTSTHCEHDSNNIGCLSLTKEERASIAAKIKEDVPFDTVLNQNQNSINDIYVPELMQISERLQFVTSSSDANITYKIVKVLDEKEACSENDTSFYKCEACKLRIHSYSCECVDYIKNNICNHTHLCVQSRMNQDLIPNNSSEVNIDNIAILEPDCPPINYLPLNDVRSSIKLKAKAFLRYYSKGILTHNFTDEELHTMTRLLDKLLDVTTKQCRGQNINTKTTKEPLKKKGKKQV